MAPTPRLAVGDKAPAFSLPDADGNTVKLSDFKGRKVIVYFYPAASTPGCTKQACDFRDSLAELNEAGLDVVGISPDKPEKLAKFRDAEGLTFPLLSDPDRKVLTAWGAFGEKSMYGKTVQGVIRSTFVVDEKGNIEVAQYNVKATGHVAKLRRDSARLARAPAQRLQQQRLRRRGALQHPEVQALVDAVRLRARVLHTGDEDLGVRERRGELGDERDRPAHPHVDRLAAPRLPEGRAGGVVDRAAGVDRVRLTDVAGRDGDLRAPRRVRSRCRVSASRCARASPPGATRMLTLARARGINVFDDFAIGVVSMPMTVIAGLAHSPLHHRAGTDLGDAVEQTGLRAHPLRADTRRRRPTPRADPATATLPSSSCRLASSRTSALSASGTTPPHMPECRPWSSVATSTTQSASPRSDTVSDGISVLQLSESAMTMTSAASRSRCAASSAAQRRRAGLLLALDEDRDAHRRVAAERADRRQMRCDAGLVVGGAAAVEPAVALGRLERRRVPLAAVALGLHVVVGVQQHRRRARGCADGAR